MADFRDFDARILSFEEAWRDGNPPVLADCLPSGGLLADPQWLPLLIELICVDLEHRWRNVAERHRSTRPLFLDDYVRQFPELGSLDELPLELIGEEYRARQCWGDRPHQCVFLTRFRSRQEQIGDLLHQIDAELRDEADEITVSSYLPAPVRPLDGTPDPDPPLAYRDYLLQRLIGAGRMGKVYRAWQRSLDRPVAVKFLRKSFLRQAEAVARFVSEARTVARFRHPGLVGVHGLGRTPGGGYFIVMDLIDGPDLAQVVKGGPVAVSDAVEWIAQACNAIEHAHQQGIVHCDLKPGNLLLGRDGRVLVTDFGLARPVAEDRRIDHGIEGTAPFMAPEQISRFWGPVGPRTDVYGLGAVLYSLLTGRSPWGGRTLADVLAQVVSGVEVVFPETIRLRIPREVTDACLRCLMKQPESRYSTVGELRTALQAETTTTPPAHRGRRRCVDGRAS